MNRSQNQFRQGLFFGERYQMDALISEGGRGDVYLCHDRSEAKTRLVAKVFACLPTESRELDSLGRELSFLRRIRHPNLARIMDFGILGKTKELFVIEEYIEGKDLYSGTEDIDAPELLKLISGLARTIHYLHARGIIHGDLKPSNLILSEAPGSWEGTRLKLLNVGLENWAPNSRQNFGNSSLAFTAPEILMGGQSSRSSDLYSLGIMIYLLLARRLPFEDEDPGFLAQKHLQGSIDLRPIERLKNGIPLSQLISRLLDKDPAKRPSTAEKAIQPIRNIIGRDSSEADLSGLESQFSGNRLIGRDKEMTILKDCARRVRGNGRGWTVFITGEAGSGKTRCMDELRSWALLNGWRVVEGACRIREEGSYSPYRQILERATPIQGEELFRFGDGAHVAASGAFDISLEYAAGQFRDLLTRELVRRVSDRPTLLLLHDFHWADESTGAVLDYLCSDIQAHPVLMCVSFRSGEKSNAAIEKVVELSIRQQRGQVVALDPLTQENVAELVSLMTADPRLKETLGSWIFRSVGGNPFFLEEMLKHLVELNLLQREGGRWEWAEENLNNLEAPASVGAVLHRRIEQLSSAASELAGWLSLFNRAVSIDLLFSTIAWNASDISEALNELSRRQMVRIETNDKERTVEFRHALISEVIRGALHGKRLRKMHRRIAEVLERESAAEKNLQELTLHCIQGWLGEKAVRYAMSLAAQARSEFAHEDALRCFEYIFRDRSGLTREDLCRAAIDASDTMFALGRPKTAMLLLKSEMSRSRTIGAELKAQMLIQLAFAYRYLGDFSEQQACCRKGLRLFRKHSGQETNTTKAMLLAELAFGAMMQSHPRRGLPFLDRALQSISGCNDVLLTGRIQILAAFIHRITGNLNEALISCKKAQSALNFSNEPHMLCSALSTFAIILMALGRYPLALEKHREAVLLSEKNRSITIRSQVLANLAECLCRMGRIQEALKTAELAEKSVSGFNNPVISSAFHAILAEIKLAADDYRGAGEVIKLLSKESGHKPALHTVGHSHFIAASYYFNLGLFDEALKNIECLSRNQTREAHFYEYELTEALRARILYERGSIRDAMNCLYSLDRSVTKKRWPYHMCIVKLHLGELFIKQQEAEPAAKYAGNALRLATAMDSIALISKARLLLGRIYAMKSRSASAITAESTDGEAILMEKAFRELEMSYRLIESNGHGETALRAQYEMCILYEKISRPGDCFFHAKQAYERICSLESQMPLELFSSYYSVFDRARIKSDLVRILDADKEPNPGAAMVELHDDEKSRILLRVSATVNSIQELDPLLEAILDQLISAMGMQRALVYLKDELTGKLQLAKGRDDKRKSLEYVEAVNQSLLEEVCRQGNPIISANLHDDPRVLPGSVGRALCSPLKTAGRVIGLLYADHSKPVGGLSESTINLFAAFCNLSAISINNALAHQQLLKEKKELEQFLIQVREDYDEIVGKSAGVEALRNRIGMAAASPLGILIIGESGTGKELIARAIHRTGRRKSEAFLPLDCGSLSDSLVEAELFGYRKGSFTGAAENRQGLLEAAQGGTVFLDEISNLPFRLQAKLLRVLEEREVRRIGETVQRKIDIQVVAATNRDLLDEIRLGRFREDLYYRLNQMEIRVPPLRERLEDIPMLIQCFLEKIAESEGGRFKRFSQDAMVLLSNYEYPGNIRELKNMVANSYYSTTGSVIGTKELPPEIRRESAVNSLSESNSAGRIYREILETRGNFEEMIQKPFLKHQMSVSALRRIVQLALKDSGGRYREAFTLLGVPEKRYAVTLQFLKRNKCYWDFRPFRRK